MAWTFNKSDFHNNSFRLFIQCNVPIQSETIRMLSVLLHFILNAVSNVYNMSTEMMPNLTLCKVAMEELTSTE